MNIYLFIINKYLYHFHIIIVFYSFISYCIIILIEYIIFEYHVHLIIGVLFIENQNILPIHNNHNNMLLINVWNLQLGLKISSIQIYSFRKTILTLRPIIYMKTSLA